MMLGLLLQVQVAFACEMVDSISAIEHCCCDEMEPTQDPLDLQGDPCCKFHNELVLKGADLEKEPPAAVRAQPAHELPSIDPYILLAALWPKEPAPAELSVVWHSLPDSADPGTKTYLSTLRLRI
jgi:hypothetical protein